MPRQAQQNVDFAGFIQLYLSEEDTAKLQALKPATCGWEKAILSFCQDGYKVSIGHDPKNHTAKCSVMDIKKGRSSAGWMLTGEAPDYWLAIMVCWYKHEVMMQHDWTDYCVEKPQGTGLR